METSIYLAKFFGIYLIILGLALFFNKKYWRLGMEELLQNSALPILMGMVTLVFGVLLVTSHNIWVADWRIVITLLAWLIFIHGTLRLWFPEFIYKVGRILFSRGLYYMIIIMLGLGLFLGYHGFF